MSVRLLFGAVADDDTGASDLAGMLAGQGLRTLLVIDLPEQSQLAEWSAGHHAVVMAEGTRNIEPGVPLCYSLGRHRLPVVLKSGNFGGEDFYARALAAASRPNEYMV